MGGIFGTKNGNKKNNITKERERIGKRMEDIGF